MKIDRQFIDRWWRSTSSNRSTWGTVFRRPADSDRRQSSIDCRRYMWHPYNRPSRVEKERNIAFRRYRTDLRLPIEYEWHCVYAMAIDWEWTSLVDARRYCLLPRVSRRTEATCHYCCRCPSMIACHWCCYFHLNQPRLSCCASTMLRHCYCSDYSSPTVSQTTTTDCLNCAFDIGTNVHHVEHSTVENDLRQSSRNTFQKQDENNQAKPKTMLMRRKKETTRN